MPDVMPDDTPIQMDDPEGSAPDGEGSQEPQDGSGSQIASQAGAQVAQLVNEALQPIVGVVESLAQEVQALKSQRSEQEVQAPVGRDVGSDEVFTQLVSDPKNFVAQLAEERTKQVLDEWAKTNLGPIMSLMLAEQSQKVEAEARNSVDAEFGEGAFDKMVKPRLDELLKNQDPRSRGFSTIVNKAIDQIIGEHRKEFFEMRQKAQQARRRDPEPLMSGGFRGTRGRDDDSDILPIAKRWVEERNRQTGDDYSVDELLKSRKIGNTLSEWKKAMGKEK